MENMIIQVDGAGSVNKGAQLMLIAVMQEIKSRMPDALLVVNHPNAGDDFVKSFYGEKSLIKRKESFYKMVAKLHLVRLAGLFSRRLSCFFTPKHAYKDVDVVFNIGGFQFGDQWHHNKKDVADWKDYLGKLKKYGTKVFFLPQAFGPFENEGSKKILPILNENVDLIMARDDVSYKYLVNGGVSKCKVLLFPDFTSLVDGKKTDCSIRHKGKVCIIPNNKIMQTGVMDQDGYLSAIVRLVEYIYSKGKEVVLLNHEGAGDFNLCKVIDSKLIHHVPIVTGLNAVETKGMIGAAYLVISSRFHGVANALNTCVPCLATSWSHKYQKLLEEYGQNDNLLDLSDMDNTLIKVDRLLAPEINNSTRRALKERNQVLVRKNREMWETIWSYIC